LGKNINKTPEKMASPDAIERGLFRSSSPRLAQHDREKIEIESIASNEEPIPTLEPPPHHHTHHGHGDGDDANIPGGNFKYEYLTFDTDVSLPGLDLHKYHSALSWTATHKTIILVLCCLCTFFAAYSAGSYSIAATPQRAKWNLSAVAFNTGVTAWAVGFALSPMFLAPFSEINGRRPVFLASAVIFLLGLIVCATTPTFAGMLVGRVLVGVGASSFSTMIGGVLSDMYTNEDRNTPMSLFSGAALAGTGAGPLCSGFIVSHVSFRWVYLHQVIGVGCLLVVVYFFFEETRGSVLLSRKARVINEYLEKTDHEREHEHEHDHDHKKNATPHDTPEDPEKPKPKPSLGGVPTRLRYKVAADESRSSFAHMLYLSLTIPFKLLFTEPVVFFFSLWTAFAWALLYMTFSVIPLVFSTRHGFDTEQSAAVFASITIGSILATIVCVFQERVAKQYWPKLTTSPEGRLYFACLEAALLPIGLFWFGWTTFSSVHWISPVLALGCAQIGIFVIYLAVFNYLADVYHRYASSALAAQGFARNIFAAVFPLFTDQMFRRLGYPGASSLLGGIAALLTLVPWVLLFNGEKIRARSKIARQIMSTEHHR
jgi:MFS family permease